MIHNFAKIQRQNFAASLRLAKEKDLPEVTGWKQAGEPEVLAAVAAHNKREAAECKARLLASLQVA